MRRGEMPAGSARQSHGRKQNEESERFLVEEIPASPRMRGRRQNSEQEPFPLVNIQRSPVMRGRREHSEEERFPVKQMAGSPIMRGRVPRSAESTRTDDSDEATAPLLTESTNVPGWNSRNDTIDNPIRNTMATTSSSIRVTIPRDNDSEAPDNDDAPPSYEASIPPNHIGWAPDVTSTVPFPMPYLPDQDNERLSNTFSYPSFSSTGAYPAIELSPLAKSYVSGSSTKSRSPVRSISPSPCSSPDRILRPAYSYQHAAAQIVRTPTRPLFTRIPEDETERFAVKQQHNEFSYRYGAMIIAFIFVVFMMILSITVKLLIKNSFSH